MKITMRCSDSAREKAKTWGSSTTSNKPQNKPEEPKRKRDAALDNFGLGSDDEAYRTPPGVTRKVRPKTPLASQPPNTAT
ncbi:unnamed protein product, partial [Pylaiella littoralis]